MVQRVDKRLVHQVARLRNESLSQFSLTLSTFKIKCVKALKSFYVQCITTAKLFFFKSVRTLNFLFCNTPTAKLVDFVNVVLELSLLFNGTLNILHCLKRSLDVLRQAVQSLLPRRYCTLLEYIAVSVYELYCSVTSVRRAVCYPALSFCLCAWQSVQGLNKTRRTRHNPILVLVEHLHVLCYPPSGRTRSRPKHTLLFTESIFVAKLLNLHLHASKSTLVIFKLVSLPHTETVSNRQSKRCHNC